MTAASLPVPIDPRARKAWPFMREIVLAMPGVIFMDEGSGTIVQVRADGGLEELNAVLRRWSVSADPTATRER